MIIITEFTPEHFTEVIALGNLVHGDNYLDIPSIEKIYHYSIQNDINASFVALLDNRVVGFRLTYAAGSWPFDQWCSTDLWPIPSQDVCYFKSNTLHPSVRRNGLGGKLLDASIAALKQQGAKGGICHVWQQSPGNAAFRYFSKAGGTTVKIHSDRWVNDGAESGYVCTLCGNKCHCDAVEMFLGF